MKKKTFYSEAAYALGLISLAVGTALMERADFGLSMVTAPAYILYLKFSQYRSFLTFGTMSYIFEAFLLVILMAVIRKARISYLFSFLTAFLFGVLLDIAMIPVSFIPVNAVMRHACYILGMLGCANGVALILRSYITPEVYDLFFKEISVTFGKDMGKVKTVYDISSCILGIILSFLFFGFGTFNGVKLGTVICAFVNGGNISRIGNALDRGFEFRDAFKLRGFFEK